ncbi:G-protein alpha subunit-domain-containing protein [Phaeosphaeriaceae sp. PMI808]|nr:G-protein alpha subunit-domain-containing protein [Phaeosphaeriaceae sp. PMI808]
MADSQADEKEVYALQSAVATNMNRLRQGIDGLRPIHNRWIGNNGISINLIAQLTALKSSLANIHDWLNHALADIHPQLLSDLAVLMTSCGMLVRHLDALINRLQQRDHDALDYAIKLKYVIGSKSMERLREVAQGQNEAVTLLLAACKCHATAQRKILLHKSRQIRAHDVKSLKVLTRSSKVNGGCLKVLTHASGIIQWFKFVYYIKLLRKQPEHHPTEEEYEIAAATSRSDAIDRALQEDATALRRETKLVIMGNRNSGKELVMHQLKALYADGYHPIDARKPFRYAMRSNIRLLIHAIIDLLKDTGIHLPSELNQHFAILLHEVETVDDSQQISQEAVKAVQAIWTCPQFSTIYLRNFEIDFPQYSPYFAQEIERIASPDYIPSEADVIRLDMSTRGVKELRFNWGELDVHLFNISTNVPIHFRNRWYHQLEGATALVYAVDISLYDRLYFGQATQSQLLDDLAAFESWSTSERFANSSIILLLNNFTRFREKLAHVPLQTLFKDFVPTETDPETSARTYILRRFKEVNRNRLSIYSFWVDLDMSDNTHLYAALKKTIQHIQQRKARQEVFSGNNSSIGTGNRSGTGLANRLLPSRSDTASRDS